MFSINAPKIRALKKHLKKTARIQTTKEGINYDQQNSYTTADGRGVDGKIWYHSRADGLLLSGLLSIHIFERRCCTGKTLFEYGPCVNLFEFADLPKNAQDPETKINRHIAVVTTNADNLNETGFGSNKTCRLICGYIGERFQKVTFHEVTDVSVLHLIIAESPDLVVLCSKYVFDSDQITRIWFSEFFDQHDIAYTGSDRAALEFDSNKSKAKAVLLNSDIATANFFLAHPNQFKTEEQLPLPLPLFIKPLDAANGNGIDQNSLVTDFLAYTDKIAQLFALYGATCLVEEVLPGREFTVAILEGADTQSQQIMPIEIIPPMNEKGDRVLGFAEKRSNEEEIRPVKEPLFSAVSALASTAFKALGARDFGRIDIKLDEAGKPHFLEANLVPGMTPETSYFPRTFSSTMTSNNAAHKAMTEKEIIWRVVELGLMRAKSTTPVSGVPVN